MPLLYQEDNSLCNVTPKIIGKCITSLKKNKSDGNKGFNSNHLIYGPLRLKVLLSMLFHSMLAHGYYPNELLKSNIISIPKDRTASLSNSDNYRGISLFNSICKLYTIMLLLNYVKIPFLPVKCNLVSKRNILPRCAQ